MIGHFDEVWCALSADTKWPSALTLKVKSVTDNNSRNLLPHILLSGQSGIVYDFMKVRFFTYVFRSYEHARENEVVFEINP
jgi:hypothetical protein